MERAKVLSTGTKGFGSPNPSWKPGDCDSKPHPPGMEGLWMPQQDFGISWGHCLICWEYPGNPFFHFQQHFFRRKRLDVPPIPKLVIPVRHALKRKTQAFCKYHVFGFGPDWAGFGLIQSDCFSGRSLCILTTGTNTA